MTWEPKFKVGDFIYFQDKIREIVSIDIDITRNKNMSDYNFKDGDFRDAGTVEDGLYKSNCRINHTGKKRENIIIQPAMSTKKDEYYNCPPDIIRGGKRKLQLNLKSKKSKHRKSKYNKKSHNKKTMKNMKNMKNMKGGKCCKCAGGRGRWGTSCYDDPSNCCKKTKTAKAEFKKSRAQTKKKTKKNSKKSYSWF